MIFIQRPEDVLSACATWATNYQVWLDTLNAFLAPLGLGLPTAQNICLGIYDFFLDFAKLDPFWPFQNFSS